MGENVFRICREPAAFFMPEINPKSEPVRFDDSPCASVLDPEYAPLQERLHDKDGHEVTGNYHTIPAPTD